MTTLQFIAVLAGIIFILICLLYRFYTQIEQLKEKNARLQHHLAYKTHRCSELEGRIAIVADVKNSRMIDCFNRFIENFFNFEGLIEFEQSENYTFATHVNFHHIEANKTDKPHDYLQGFAYVRLSMRDCPSVWLYCYVENSKLIGRL